MQLPFDPMTPEEIEASSLVVAVEKAPMGGFVAIRKRTLGNKTRTLCYAWGWTEKEALEKLETVAV